MINKDIKNYKKGFAVAKQLCDIVVSGNNKSSIEDYPEIKEWVASNVYAEEVLSNISDSTFIEEFNISSDTRIKNAKRLRESANSHRRYVAKRRVVLFSSSFAAAMVVISFLIFSDKTAPKLSETIATSIDKAKPTLILSDGKTIDLNNAGNIIDEKSGVKIDKNSSNKLSYSSSTLNKNIIEYNTIVIPSMTRYTLELSDGTIVVVNANSILKYPVAFNGDSREVFLEGEAYFEVKKSNKPFIVKADDVDVRVYGTQFNVNSYSLNNISATLIEGSIGISVCGKNEIVLKPNQNAEVLRGTTDILVKNVDSKRHTAWIDGFIRSDNEPVTFMLNEFSVWYGVEFEFSERAKKVNIEASFDSKRSLEEALKAIEKITDLKFEKRGGTKYIVY